MTRSPTELFWTAKKEERLKVKVVKVSEKSIVKGAGNWTNDRVSCPSYQEASVAILHWQTILNVLHN